MTKEEIQQFLDINEFISYCINKELFDYIEFWDMISQEMKEEV